MGPILRGADQGADTAVWLLACDEADGHAGALWHDRRLRNRLPRAGRRASRPRTATALWAELERLTAGRGGEEG